ncbi:MAG: protein kinase domain-containing protein [Anaerolineae bacterium]
MSDYENKVIRGYRLNQAIGAGGFGTVYHAQQEVLNREVAVKVIKEKYVNEPQFVRQFEAEARLIARMEHFNIVTLYDYWRDPSGAYLVMRWLRGGSLRNYLKQQRIDIAQTMRVINQTASALAFAHQNNVIHRDIKPENILLDLEGNAFLTDFGIAVDLRDRDGSNMENISFGSPDYVAPEQLKEKVISPRSDIYSLGIMLYELLASERPFIGNDAKEIMKMQLFNPVPSLRLKRPDLPPEIDTVIWQSTAKNPAHRYSNVLELAVAFQNIARNLTDIPANYFINTQTRKRVKLSPRITDHVVDLSPEHLNEEGTPVVKNDEQLVPQWDDTLDTLADPITIIDTPPPGKKQQQDTMQFSDLDDGGTIQFSDLADDGGGDNFADLNASDDMMTRDFDDFSPSQDPKTVQFIGDPFEDLMTLTIEGEAPPNPYKGLQAFEEGDAKRFFGREELVERLVQSIGVSQSRFLALIGASGSGKSSLVRAGMIPALREDAVEGSREWFYSTMVPGDDPLRELSEAILRIAIIAPENWGISLSEGPQKLHQLLNLILPDDGSELLLFIDQFEETFTLCDDEQMRQLFLDSLWYAVHQPDSRLRLIITLRADFYDRPLHYPQFGQMLQEHTEIVLPLNLQELEASIMEPARRVSLGVEPALKNAILNDVQGQPGALPLLQYALTELYERKPDNAHALTLEQYNTIDGLAGAIARRASEIYTGTLDGAQQNVARKLFLRIIAIDENGTVTRRRVLWSEMLQGIDDPAILQQVVEAFEKYRLLTRDHDQVTRAPTIEVAHEAIIKSWELLRQWIEQNRIALQKRQELRVEVDRWLNSGREKSYLAKGLRLADFERLLHNDLLALRQEEQDYIAEGIREREADIERKRRANNLLRMISVAAVTLFVVAMIGFYNATLARNEAIEAERIARSRELASSAIANDEQHDLALLLAIEAETVANTYEATNSLLRTLQTHPLVRQYLHGHSSDVRAIAFDQSGTIVVTGGFGIDGNTLLRHNLSDGTLIGEPIRGHQSWINDVQISPDNRIIASASADATVRLWDFETGAELAVLEGHTRPIWALAFSPDGQYVASAGEDGHIIVWDVAEGTIARIIDAQPDPSELDNPNAVVQVYTLDFNADGTRLLSGGDDSLVRLWDAETGTEIRILNAHQDWVRTVQFDPDNEAIVSGDRDGILYFWDADTGAVLTSLRTPHENGIYRAAFSLEGEFMATVGADNQVIVWELASGGIIARIAAHRAQVWDVAFSPNANNFQLVSAGEDGQVIVSQLNAVVRPGRLAFSTNLLISELEHDPLGERFVLAGEPFGQRNSMVQVLSEEISLLYELDIATISNGTDTDALFITDLAVHPERELGAVTLATGEIVVWALADGDVLWIENQHSAIPKELEFTPDGARIISADETGEVLIWSSDDGTLADRLNANSALGVTALAISPDGAYLAIGGRDNITLWEIATATEVMQIADGHTDAVIAVLFSADGQQIFASSRDRTITQWSVPDGQLRQRFEGHRDWVLSLALSPSGQLLVSGDRAGTLRLWDMRNGRPIGDAISGPEGWLTDLHFIDAQTVLGSNRDNGIAIEWTVDVQVWTDLACTISNRQLSTSEWSQFLPGTPHSPTCISVNEVTVGEG